MKLPESVLDGLQRLLEQRFSNTCRRHAECKVHLVRYEPENNSVIPGWRFSP